MIFFKKKLERYGISGNTNNWFRSYLKDRNQIVSILGFESNERTLSPGVPQWSVLGPELFILYINDIHIAIKASTVFHFTDDTHLILIGDCIQRIKIQFNADLKALYRWLLANKISLNVSKTELIIFNRPQQKSPKTKITLNGAKIFPSNSIKYLGVHIDADLSGFSHWDKLLPKLRRANGMLAKARHYIADPTDLLSLSLLFTICLHFYIWSSNLGTY